jgi:SAM-dependent methyltransferase
MTALSDLVLDPNGFLLYDNPDLYALMIPRPDSETGRFMNAMIQRFNGGRRVLDVGSGMGRDAAYLRTIGYEATGLEYHPQMLAYSQRAFPDGRYFAGDMRDFSLGERFDAITCMGSAFLYNETNEDLLAALRCFHDHLVPGGMVLLDIRNGAYHLTRESWTEWLDEEETDELQAGDLTIGVTDRYRIDLPAHLLRRTRRWTIPDRAEPLVQESAWRLLFPQELRLLLSLTGFSVTVMFDRPGSSATEPWTRDDLPLSETVHGPRLHVVARAE